METRFNPRRGTIVGEARIAGREEGIVKGPAPRGDRTAHLGRPAGPHRAGRTRRRRTGLQRRPARARPGPLPPALTLALDRSAGRLRIEVTDACGDLRPLPRPATPTPDPLATAGRGLTLVTALTDHWDCVPFPPSGKTVRAVLTTPALA